MNSKGAGILLVGLLLGVGLQGAGRDELWEVVKKATQVREGSRSSVAPFPRTAATNLDLIIAGALKDKAYAEAARAVVQRVMVERDIAGLSNPAQIELLQARITLAPPEMLPILRCVEARWIWRYYEGSGYRLRRRTALSGSDDKDLATWDLPRVFAEIDRKFTLSLQPAAALQRIPITEFDALFERGDMPDAYRPTLYDFLAYEALSFYGAEEQVGARPENWLQLRADQPVYGVVHLFGTVEEFLAGTPERRPDASNAEKALFLFRDLLRFHLADEDPTALIHADLGRLMWAHGAAVGEEKETLLDAALERVVERWSGHAIVTEAMYPLATRAHHAGLASKARDWAKRAVESHPNSRGADLCRGLLVEIEGAALHLRTEYVWNARPEFNVTYRNLTNVHFRLIPIQMEEVTRWNRDQRSILKREPARRWSVAVPGTPDFKMQTVAMEAPSDLAQGLYLLVASIVPDASNVDDDVAAETVCISDLAVVIRSQRSLSQGFVLDAASGEPIEGAVVEVWTGDGGGEPIGTVRSDRDGHFVLGKDPGNRNFTKLRATLNGRTLVVLDDRLRYELDDEPQESQQTVLFTDRALYRPGQPIQYKGICVARGLDRYGVMKGCEVVVVFSDSNQKEIARRVHHGNEFGSFSGSFHAPSDRVGGMMRIRVWQGPKGEVDVQVAEYKRPKFQVTLETPAKAPRLGESVVVMGKAQAFTGAGVDGARVEWTVKRGVRWPEWVPWWSWDETQVMEAYAVGKEIARGTGRTQGDGTFQIAFTAEASRALSPTNAPVFEFEVHVDVTEPAGETRSADRTVAVGYTAMEVTLAADAWQTSSRPIELAIRTASFDGVGLSAEGVVRVFKVVEPAHVVRVGPKPFHPSYYDSTEDSTAGALRSMDPCQAWPMGEQVKEEAFRTDAAGKGKVQVRLPVGVYRAVVETTDRLGTPVKAMVTLKVVDPEAQVLALKIPSFLIAPTWSVEPGQEFLAVWGTGYEVGRAFVEVEHRGRMIQRYWTEAGRTQQPIRVPVTESMRGGFTIHVTQVRENRAYLHSQAVEVPWSNKELGLKWDHFVSKLEPGGKETWSLVISTPTNAVGQQSAQRVAAELVATLYDASLDKMLAWDFRRWPQRFEVLARDRSSLTALAWNGAYNVDSPANIDPQVEYLSDYDPRRLPDAMALRPFGREQMGAMAQIAAAPTAATVALGLIPGMLRSGSSTENPDGSSPAKSLMVVQVNPRRNLNETAFFFPHLLADTNGEVRMTFTMPEALTTWRFMGFAHDRELRSGYLEAEAVTAKDLMVQPNPPRFLREGDELEFAVKVSNQSTNRQTGKVQLSLRYAENDAPADLDLKLAGLLSSVQPGGTELTFDIPAKESRTFSWRLVVPDGCGFLAYKAVGSTGTQSDGEEGWMPVLPRRILVTESLPLPIRGKVGGGDVTKKFELEKLVASGQSDTLKHQGYTVQMVSQPAWYAVMALPYLMEFPHECSEQIFNRYYANALAWHIAVKDPKILRIFDLWKGTAALDSPLEKNAELKSVILMETPWVRQAQKESEARRDVGMLFDANRLASEQSHTLQKLAEMQGRDGLWPWFPGGRGSDYITLYIVTGFGRLRHLGTEAPVAAALKALGRLDTWMEERYREIQKWPKPTDYVPGATECLYLYGRSFFLKDKPLADGAKEAVDFFMARAREHWAKVESRQNQGHLALALHRFGGEANEAAAQAIARSLKERAVRSEEMGMFWRETELSWWWYRAPIETQAMMIEVFDEVAGDREAVEECRVWLLKQKQTQDWKTTKATADAVYALLLRGGNLLGSDRLVEVKVGGVDVTPGLAKTPGTSQPEAGTGYYERRFGPGEVKASMGEITVRKVDEGVSWGSVHWQYWEDMAKVTAYEGTPLKLKKSVYRRVNTGKGPVLEAVKGAWKVGDELVVRVELRVDRNMEFVHLKDQRGSGTEPVNVLSGYRFQDGLRYYESTRDTASHFYIDYLSKGTYVFEYATRVQQRGRYQTGIASIQCMYAPEFNSHSESIELTVK